MQVCKRTGVKRCTRTGRRTAFCVLRTSKSCRNRADDPRVVTDPTMISFSSARVTATLMRRQSRKRSPTCHIRVAGRAQRQRLPSDATQTCPVRQIERAQSEQRTLPLELQRTNDMMTQGFCRPWNLSTVRI